VSKHDLQDMDRRDGHYHLEGEKLVSVTTAGNALAKPALINWAARQTALAIFDDPYTYDTVEKAVAAHSLRKGEAAERGKAVHYLVEQWAKGTLPPQNALAPAYSAYEEGFRKFLRAWDPKTLYSEVVLRNLTHRYAGRVDWIGTLGTETYILDFKTSKAVWKDQGLQLVAYKNAEELRPGPRGTPFIPMPKVDHTAVVLIPGDGTFDFKMVDEPFDVFLALKDVHKWWTSE